MALMFGGVPGYLGGLLLGRLCDNPHPVEGELCLLEAIEGVRSEGLEVSTCGVYVLEGKCDKGIPQSMLPCCVYTYYLIWTTHKPHQHSLRRCWGGHVGHGFSKFPLWQFSRYSPPPLDMCFKLSDNYPASYFISSPPGKLRTQNPSNIISMS